MQTSGIEPSSGEAIEQLDLWWNLLMAGGILGQYHNISWYRMQLSISLHLFFSQLMIQRDRGLLQGMVQGKTEGDVLLDISVWGNKVLCPWRSGGKKKGYFLAPAKLRYDLRKTCKKPYLGRGSKDPGCQIFSRGSFLPSGRTLCCQGSHI